MRKKFKKHYNSGIRQQVINHISSNISLYLKTFLILILGICIGIVIVNHLPETGMESINKYITNSINVLKDNIEISKGQMLKSSVLKNIVIVLIIWIFGLTLVGNFILYFITLFIGITFGYTLAAIVTSFSLMQGILFFLTAMFIQNIINIPSILFLIVQGIKSHQDILSKQNSPKYVLVRHSSYSFLVLILLAIASLIEVYVSGNLIYYVAKYL